MTELGLSSIDFFDTEPWDHWPKLFYFADFLGMDLKEFDYTDISDENFYKLLSDQNVFLINNAKIYQSLDSANDFVIMLNGAHNDIALNDKMNKKYGICEILSDRYDHDPLGESLGSIYCVDSTKFIAKISHFAFVFSLDDFEMLLKIVNEHEDIFSKSFKEFLINNGRDFQMGDGILDSYYAPAVPFDLFEKRLELMSVFSEMIKDTVMSSYTFENRDVYIKNIYYDEVLLISEDSSLDVQEKLDKMYKKLSSLNYHLERYKSDLNDDKYIDLSDDYEWASIYDHDPL